MSSTVATTRVWRALASPVRRKILDRLHDGPRTTGELAGSFRSLSRFAVMQHLGVLHDARLIVIRREGRQRFNHLNVVPLQQIYDRWVAPRAGRVAGGLLALKRSAEKRDNHEGTKSRRKYGKDCG